MNRYRIYPSKLCIVKELPNMNDYPVAPPKGSLLYAPSFQSLGYINFMDVFSFGAERHLFMVCNMPFKRDFKILFHLRS